MDNDVDMQLREGRRGDTTPPRLRRVLEFNEDDTDEETASTITLGTSEGEPEPELDVLLEACRSDMYHFVRTVSLISRNPILHQMAHNLWTGWGLEEFGEIGGNITPEQNQQERGTPTNENNN